MRELADLKADEQEGINTFKIEAVNWMATCHQRCTSNPNQFDLV